MPAASHPIALRYNRAMRRLIAILLLLIPGLPVVSPLMAVAAGRDSALPACCRRNGAHHCDNGDAVGNSSIPHIQSQQQRCPCYPGATVSTVQNGAATLASSPL